MGRMVSQPLWAGQSSQDEHGDAFAHWRVSEEAVRLRAYFISLETGGMIPVLTGDGPKTSFTPRQVVQDDLRETGATLGRLSFR